jgi:hypothetical protein
MWVGAEGSKTLLRVRMRTVDGGEPYLLVAPQTLRVSDSDAAGEGSGLLDLRYRGDSCSGSPGEDLQLKGLTEARIEVVRVGTQQARVFAGRIRISLPRRVVEDTESVHLTGCGLPGVDLVLETATSGPE